MLGRPLRMEGIAGQRRPGAEAMGVGMEEGEIVRTGIELQPEHVVIYY